MTINVTVEWPEITAFLKAHGLQPGGLVQTVIDSEFIRYADPYVPFRTGALKGSALTATVLGSGEVVYATPYAARMYSHPEYNFNGAPMRGAYWPERMLADHKQDIVRAAQAAAAGGL